MAISKLINLLVLSSLAVLLCTLDAVPVAALAHGNRMVKEVRHAAIVDSVRKSKRDGQNCRPRDTPSQSDSQPSASSPSPSPYPSPSSASQDSSPTPTPSPSASPSASPDESSTPTPSASPSASPSTSPSASSSASPSASPSSSSSSGSSFGSTKLGLAWGADISWLDVVMNANPNIKYIYNWGPNSDPKFSQYNLDFVPMLWDGSDRVAAFQQVVKPGYASYAAGFNEYNEQGQANMDAGSMIQAWNQYLVPLRSQGYKLIAPVSSSNPDGEPTFQTFLNGIDRSTVDFCAVHYYGTSGQGMIDYIEQWLNICDGIPIVITEYACQNYNLAYENNGQQCSYQQTLDFYKTVIDYVNGNDRIAVHCPFGFLTDLQGVNEYNRLIDSNGLTDLGNQIVTGSI